MRSREKELPNNTQLRKKTIDYARRRLPRDIGILSGALYLTGKALVLENNDHSRWANELRHYQIEKAQQAVDIYPGYFEHQHLLETPFFTLEHGHLDWLNQINQLQPIQSIGESTLKAIYTQGGVAKLGDLIQLYIEHTHAHLQDYAHEHFSTSTYPPELIDALNSKYADTIIYYASVALGGTVTPFIPDIHTQYNFPPNTFSKNHWDQRNGYMKLFPGIFPAAGHNSGIEYAGKDRTAHAMSHLAFVHVLNKSQQYNLPYHQQFPVGLSAIKGSFDVLVPGFANQRMSVLVGLGWEIRNTLTYLRQYFKGEKVMDGLLDPEVDFDIVGGNALGALVGNYLKRINAAKINDLRFILNSSEIHQPNAHPMISQTILDALSKP